MRRRAWSQLCAILLLLGAAPTPAAEHLTAWVALAEPNRVAVLDLASGTETHSFELDSPPTALALTPDDEYLYVASRVSGQTSVVTPLSGGLYKRLPYTLPLFIPGDAAHYFAPGLGGIFRYEVDGYAFQQLAWLPDTQNAFAYAVSPDGVRFVFIQHFVDWRGLAPEEIPAYSHVAVCDLQANTGTYLELGFEPLRAAVSPAGDRGLVGGAAGGLALIDPAEPPRVLHQEALELPVPFVGFSPAGDELYFTQGRRLRAAPTAEWETAGSDSCREMTLDGEGGDIADGAMTPDGRIVLLTADGGVYLADPSTNEVRLVTKLTGTPRDLIAAELK